MNLETLQAIKFVGALLATAAAGYSLWAQGATTERKRIILLLWMVLPPVFFFFEYYFQAPLLKPDELARFKDLQSLASSIWAGVTGALAVAYFKKD